MMKNAWLATLSFLQLLSCLQLGFADVHFLPRTKDDLPPDTTEEDEMVHVSGAKVAYFNRYALERDFPFLRGKGKAEIQNWILACYSYVSAAQLKLNGIRNSEIPFTSNRKIGFRPHGWKRAAVIPCNDENGKNVGLVDVKGTGISANFNDSIKEQTEAYEEAKGNQVLIDTLRIKGHSDGLASFGEANAEVVRAQVLQKIFDQDRKTHNTSYEAIEHYFVIQMPFDILKEGDKKEKAALIGRQAHVGRIQDPSKMPDSLYIDPHGEKQFDLFGAAVDMGGVFPTASEFQSRFLTEEQRVKFQEGDQSQTTFDPQKSLEWKYAHEAAAAFLKGDHDSVQKHVETMVGERVDRPDHKRFDRLSQALVHALTDPKWGVMLTAFTYLSRIKPNDQETVSSLRQLLKHSAKDTRDFAAQILGEIKPTDQGIHLALVDLLKDPERSTRDAASRALAQMELTDPHTLRALVEVLKDPLGCYAAAQLLESNKPTDPHILSSLIEVFKNPNPRVRRATAQVLMKIAPTDLPTDQGFRLTLVKLLKDPDLHVRSAASRVLLKIMPIDQETLLAIQRLLKHSKAEAREAAAKILGKLETADLQIVSALVELLKDPESSVREGAADALGNLKAADPHTVSALSELLKDPTLRVRASAAIALGKIKPTDSHTLCALVELLKDPGQVVRGDAADALENIRPTDPHTLNAILKLIEDPTFQRKSPAFEILKKIMPTGREFHRQVARGLLNENAEIRGLFKDLVDELKIQFDPTGLQSYLKSDCSSPMEKVIDVHEMQEVMNYLSSEK
jgi:HEAT repeat protein